MKTKAFLTIAFAALVIMSTGCKKSSFWSPTPGDRISFRASSSLPIGNNATRTAYSGEYFTVEDEYHATPYKMERIDWVAGDLITVAYISTDGDQLWNTDTGAYRITDVWNNNGLVSFANIEPKNGNALQWRDAPIHMFYACYPAVDEDEEYVFSTEGGMHATVPFDFPQAQQLTRSATDANVYLPDMAHAPLLCGDSTPYQSPTNFDRYVELKFDPHFTAFEFQAAAKEDDSFTVNSFTLSSANTFITGRFLWSMDPTDNNEWHDFAKEGATYKTATVDFTALNNGNPISLTDSQPITFSVIVCCPDVVGGSNYLQDLTITFNINKDGTPVNRSLKLAYSYGTDNYVAFAHNRKHRIYGLRVPLEIGPGSLWFEGVDAGSYTDDNLSE